MFFIPSFSGLSLSLGDHFWILSFVLLICCQTYFTGFLLINIIVTVLRVKFGCHPLLSSQSITHLIPTFYEDMGQGQEFVFEDEVSTGSYWEEDKEETEESERQMTTRKEDENVQNENEKVKVKE